MPIRRRSVLPPCSGALASASGAGSEYQNLSELAAMVLRFAELRLRLTNELTAFPSSALALLSLRYGVLATKMQRGIRHLALQKSVSCVQALRIKLQHLLQVFLASVEQDSLSCHLAQ